MHMAERLPDSSGKRSLQRIAGTKDGICTTAESPQQLKQPVEGSIYFGDDFSKMLIVFGKLIFVAIHD